MLYPGIGLYAGLMFGAVFAMVLLVLQRRARGPVAETIARLTLFSSAAAVGLGVMFAAPMLGASVLSAIAALVTVAVFGLAGRTAARMSSPWLLTGRG